MYLYLNKLNGLDTIHITFLHPVDPNSLEYLPVTLWLQLEFNLYWLHPIFQWLDIFGDTNTTKL